MTEPLYCAEQIKIPPSLPDILKAYTKHILRLQPTDIIASSAEYFSTLAAQKVKSKNKVLSGIQLEAVYAKLVAKDKEDGSVKVGKKELEGVLESVGVNVNVDEILMLGGWTPTDRIPWIKFWSFLVASSSGTLHATIESVCRIIGDAGVVPTAVITDVLVALTESDREIDSKAVAEVFKVIKNSGKDMPVDKLLDVLRREIKQSSNAAPTSAEAPSDTHRLSAINQSQSGNETSSRKSVAVDDELKIDHAEVRASMAIGKHDESEVEGIVKETEAMELSDGGMSMDE